MAIKDLAVAYNDSSNSKAALAFALQMCRKYDAALSGLHVRLPLNLEPQVRRWMPKEVHESLVKAGDEAVAEIEAGFREAVAASGFAGEVAWHVEEGQTNEHLARLARFHDLLVIGQFSEAGDNKRLRVRAEDLVLRSGKPLIVVPNGYEVRPFQEFAAVAWDGSRPAARALSDAMQILETKKRLDVVRVAAPGHGTPPSVPPGRDILRHLARHGIEAKRVRLSAAKDGIGAAILDHCAQSQPDVLVMGAYGHARLREDLFGGVTRHILQHMNVPVLMAH
ncbi:MAG: universal stress protein [Pseudomonadota bacterium]